MRALPLLRLLPLFLLLHLSNAPGQIGGDFTLTDQDGKRFQLDQLRGKVVVLLFGYTACPDICPTGLTSIAAVSAALGDSAQGVQGVFVSVDPERDRPEVLKKYLRYFGENLIGLTGTPDEIAGVAARYRTGFRKIPRADGQYAMEHSAQTYVIDRRGVLFSAIPYGVPAEHLLNVVQDLLDASAADSAVAAGQAQ